MSLLRMFRSINLRAKVVLPISILLIATIMFISSYLIERQADGFRRELETSGETMIRMLAMSVESGVLFESKYELDDALKILSQFEVVKYASIYNADSVKLAEIGTFNDTGYVRVKKIVHGGMAGSNGDDYYITDKADNEFIELNYPVMSRIEKLDRENLGITGGLENSVGSEYVNENIGSIKLILSLSLVNKSIADAEKTAILLTVIVLLLSLAMLTFLVRFITRPIRQLVDATDQISKGDLSQRLNIRQHDEIGHLASTFNNMVESLELSRREIEQYNRTLEQKIIERTMELEHAQAQLVQSEKLGAIGQLAAGVAHELNNPLGGILGYAQFALEKMKKNVPENTSAKEIGSYIKYLSDIETQARRCKNIVQSLLRFSRSSRSTDFADVDINHVIRDTCTFVEHQLNMNQIELHLELDEKLPIIQANAGQLQQVFTNLIINAMHASPPDTTITIATRLSPALGEFNGAIEILCRDQGVGIPPENIKKIFEPFFTTKDVGKGTGLGLAVSYGIVKEHGGEIKVDSKPGQGTTFTIILPVQKSASVSDTQGKDYISLFANKPM